MANVRARIPSANTPSPEATTKLGLTITKPDRPFACHVRHSFIRRRFLLRRLFYDKLLFYRLSFRRSLLLLSGSPFTMSTVFIQQLPSSPSLFKGSRTFSTIEDYQHDPDYGYDGDREEHDAAEEAWDFKCVGLNDDPACPPNRELRQSTVAPPSPPQSPPKSDRRERKRAPVVFSPVMRMVCTLRFCG